MAAGLAIALGVGATAATFSVVDTVLLKPLAYADADRLMVVMHRTDHPVAPANFIDWQRESTSFSSMAAAEYWTPNLGGPDLPEKIQALRITAGMLPMLGVAPALGRTFNPARLTTTLWSSRGACGSADLIATLAFLAVKSSSTDSHSPQNAGLLRWRQFDMIALRRRSHPVRGKG